MVRTLPPDLGDELLKDAIHLRHLITLYLSPNHYWTDCDQGIIYAGVWYSPRDLKFDPPILELTGEAASLRMTIPNINKAFSNYVLNYEIRGKECRIDRVALDISLKVVGGPALLFSGYLDKMDIDRKIASIEVYNQFIKWKTPTPRRMQLPTCGWVFKGSECGYSGSETTCDKTVERCVSYGNYVNFGGFRFVSTMAQKEIWWGTKQKLWH
jgi:hypothetical protein